MSTRGQIRQQVLDQLRETTSDTHFTSDQLNSFCDQAIRLAAVIIEHPRDFVEVQADSAADAYSLPSDNLLVRTVYFGDPSINRDVRPLLIISEETLRELYPSWLDTSTVSRGRPRYFVVLDKNTFLIYPKADSTEAATGKKIHINYVYVPAALNDDGQSPDLPLPYHDILKFYICSLCYNNLGNAEMSKGMFNEFTAHHKLIESASTKETKEGMYFQWGYDEDVNNEYPEGGVIIP